MDLVADGQGLFAQDGPVELWGEWVARGATGDAWEALDRAHDYVCCEDLEGAIEILDEALLESPAEPSLLRARGTILAELNFLRAAELELERASGSDPTCPFTWWALGYVRHALGLTNGAAQALRVALELGARDRELLLLLAEVERRNGDDDLAARYGREAASE